MTGLLHWVTLVTAVGCGLSAGVFFAFSAFVMPALGRLPPAQGHRRHAVDQQAARLPRRS